MNRSVVLIIEPVGRTPTCKDCLLVAGASDKENCFILFLTLRFYGFRSIYAQNSFSSSIHSFIHLALAALVADILHVSEPQ